MKTFSIFLILVMTLAFAVAANAEGAGVSDEIQNQPGELGDIEREGLVALVGDVSDPSCDLQIRVQGPVGEAEVVQEDRVHVAGVADDKLVTRLAGAVDDGQDEIAIAAEHGLCSFRSR